MGSDNAAIRSLQEAIVTVHQYFLQYPPPALNIAIVQYSCNIALNIAKIALNIAIVALNIAISILTSILLELTCGSGAWGCLKEGKARRA